MENRSGTEVSATTLTTDFGTRDWFTGTMKGVILGINPRATIEQHDTQSGRGETRRWNVIPNRDHKLSPDSNSEIPTPSA
jgi:hypothetical protein